MPARRPDVTFRSAVTARRMRFTEVPESRVAFRGRRGHGSTAGSRRVHLPTPAAPGRAYRDVRVDYRIVARLVAGNDRCAGSPAGRDS